ncbi:hypothetical protein PVAR5_7819 [Paecilomyces variotii No. 5]|uniref:GPI anchored protein n=1 Tax=Byssochlamys spectabilis (strain No. 5 / NBRC 109023) TaxID=1356009 RepID=V5G3W1_BYSSN|nr:hypothetical protein PVAR5_7819 [Paecilomyces variotii No. 5]
MSSKFVVLFVLWAFVVLGHGAKFPREVDALEGYITSLEVLGDNMNLHDADDAAKFNHLFARAETVTTTVTVEMCSSTPGTTVQTGTTTAVTSAATTSSAPVVPVPVPIPTSSIYSVSGHAPIPPHSSVESVPTSTVPATSSVPAETTSALTSSVPATGTSAAASYTHAPSPSGTAAANGAPKGMPSAMLGMAVAMVALITL